MYARKCSTIVLHFSAWIWICRVVTHKNWKEITYMGPCKSKWQASKQSTNFNCQKRNTHAEWATESEGERGEKFERTKAKAYTDKTKTIHHIKQLDKGTSFSSVRFFFCFASFALFFILLLQFSFHVLSLLHFFCCVLVFLSSILCYTRSLFFRSHLNERTYTIFVYIPVNCMDIKKIGAAIAIYRKILSLKAMDEGFSFAVFVCSLRAKRCKKKCVLVTW